MQCGDELTRRHRRRTGVDDVVPALDRHVVVVAVEPAFGDADQSREGMQLVERGVTGQVAPQPTVLGNLSIVDEDRHSRSMPGPTLHR